MKWKSYFFTLIKKKSQKQPIAMISEEPCDSEDRRNDSENSALSPQK